MDYWPMSKPWDALWIALAFVAVVIVVQIIGGRRDGK